MNEPQAAAFSGGDDAGTAAPDIDARFDPAASGASDAASHHDDPGAAPVTASRPMTMSDLTMSCNAWVRDQPIQALALAAGLGFLLGRLGR